MRPNRPDLVQVLVAEEIRRSVADAIRQREIVNAAAIAAKIMKVYPRCGLIERELVNEVAMAAVKASLAVEIDHSRAA